MPKTKFQNFIFTLMTVVLMAYCMIVYSLAINSPEANKSTFFNSIKRISNRGDYCFFISIFCWTISKKYF